MVDKGVLRSQIGRQLDSVGLKYRVDDDGDCVIPFNDAIVFAGPGAVGDYPVAKVWSIVATGVSGNAALAEYVNEANCKMVFGKLCYYPDQSAVMFETPLLATDLDASELQWAVLTAATMTDEFNDPIVSRWGGMKFVI